MSWRGILDRLPEGTVAIGIGLAANGVTAYLFITFASRDLGADAYSPVGNLWAMVFLLGNGFFQPLEQELARLIASRRSHGYGVGPVLRRAAVIGGGFILVLLLLALVLSPWLIREQFDGQGLLFVGLLMAVVGYGIGHLLRGVVAGEARFSAYRRFFIGDGVGRLVVTGLIVLLGARSAGWYGVAIGSAPLIAIVVALRGERGLSNPGPPAKWSDLSRALGSLLAASVLTAFLLNVSPLAVDVLANEQEGGESGRFLNALLVARIPLFFFQAVQASLLPRLSEMAGASRFHDLWSELRKLLGLVVVLGVGAVVAALVLGPLAVEIAFGEEFKVSRRDMALLTTSSAGLMIALSVAQALIACQRQAQVAMSWAIGVATFFAIVAVGNDLFLRVELGLIGAVVVSALVMASLLVRRLHTAGVRIASADA